jgi:hypothetical protein
MEIPPFNTKLPVTYSTVNNLRTDGMSVCPELMVRLPFTIIQEDAVSCVEVNQSVVLNDDMVVFAFRVV